MQTFLDFIKDNHTNQLDEALITFGKRAYPKFNQVVILAGGAGSGKGFVTNKLLGIEGKVFDVDRIKELAIKSDKFAKKVKEETGHDIKKFDLTNPNNVSQIHGILSDVYGVTSKHQQTAYSSLLLANPNRKPNLIFDVTLKDITKLHSISNDVLALGYDKRNIHIVWVMNDVKVAMKQNLERERRVPENILISTHTGAAITMKRIIQNSTETQTYMDGDIWIAFNKRGADTSMKVGERGGMYIVDSNYFKVKSQGQKSKSYDELSSEIVAKIKDYAPHHANR